MYIVLVVGEEILKAAKNKFYIEAKELSKRPLDINKADPFWRAEDKNDGESLFTKLIAKGKNLSPVYLNNQIFYKGRSDNSGKTEHYVPIKNDYLIAFLEYLELLEGTLEERVIQFCRDKSIDSKIIEYQEVLLSEKEKIRSSENEYISFDNIKKIKELRKDLGKLMFKSSELPNTKWWFYLHGYTRHKLIREAKNTWPLVKLILIIEDINQDGDIIVRLENTGIEHYDYIGSIDFFESEILVMNLNTVPYLGRQLNVKVHVGTGEGELCFGQYMNFESDDHVISGSLILQKINERKDLNPQAAVHDIPFLEKDKKEYEEDHSGVSRFILQYLHDKNKNFRRTPLRVGHSLKDLRKWLMTRKEEDDE